MNTETSMNPAGFQPPLKVLVTFGGGAPRYRDSVSRLVRQAQRTGFFDCIEAWTDERLKKDPRHAGFWHKFGAFIDANPRGYGYWLWKPYLLVFYMRYFFAQNVELYYLDGGCEVGDLHHILNLQQLLQQRGFLYTGAGHAMAPYCKKSVMDHYDPHGVYSDRPMYQACLLAFQARTDNLRFLEDWYAESAKLWTLCDTEDRNKEPSGFIDHRHDQAVMSYVLYGQHPHLLSEPCGSEFYAAFPSNRVRHGKSNRLLHLLNNINLSRCRFYALDDYETIRFSSSSGWTTPEDGANLVSRGSKPGFSFHTGKEREAWVELEFKTPQFLSYLLVENRGGVHALQPMCLDILYTAEAQGPLQLHSTLNTCIGSMDDHSPLLMSFPYGFKVKRLRLVRRSDQPEYFHLKSVYLIN